MSGSDESNTPQQPSVTPLVKPAAVDDRTVVVNTKEKRHLEAAAIKEPIHGAAINPPEKKIPVKDSAATQFTQYNAPSNYSAGFAQARELVKRSQSGQGTLLKKRFLLEDVLGHGGMGTVYKAKDLRKVEAEDPNPYIATKVLNQDFRDHPDAFVTLQQEAAKSQTLAHPNIVTVHDFDRDGDTLFMTMELLQGQPLDRMIKERRNQGLPKEQVWTITRDLCAALAYAHQRQLIHADFKPGNVFVSSDGSAKVLDFGIARAASKESQKHKFDAGQLGALTPAYATVEMVQDEPLSFSDDVYALACVVYEMLSGRHPYNNCSALDAIKQNLVPKPLPGLTKNEWRALSHGLALKKSDRTETVLKFADELFPKRNAPFIRVVLVVAVLSVVGASWFGWKQYQVREQVKQTVAEKIAAAQLCFAKSDFTCAVEQSLIAVNMDTGNQVAAQLLEASQLAKADRVNEEKIVQLMADAEKCLLDQDIACVKVKAREALSLSPDNHRAEQLFAEADALEQNRILQGYSQQVDTCLAQQDMGCVQMFTNKAQELNPEHELSKQLAKNWLALQQQSQTNAEQQQQKLQAALAQAKTCMNQKGYTCAIANAVDALAVDPSNVQAIEIKQAAQLAQQQSAESSRKIEKLLAEANECMSKKNYSCTIAKAESALDLDASNANALALKLKAQETQRKLKETGLIIK